jgi:hypothetical protein
LSSKADLLRGFRAFDFMTSPDLNHLIDDRERESDSASEWRCDTVNVLWMQKVHDLLQISIYGARERVFDSSFGL